MYAKCISFSKLQDNESPIQLFGSVNTEYYYPPFMRKFIIYSIIGFLGCSAAVSCGSGDKATSDSNVTDLQAHPEPGNSFTDPLNYTDVAVHGTDAAKNSAIKGGVRHHDRIHVNPIGPLAEVFNDSNKYQYAWAEKLGIDPITDLSQAYATRRPLRKVRTCDAYYVDELTHSYPYLVPEAEDLLKQIGYNFIDSLARRGADGYKIKVTSLLRTPATVKKLRKVNSNAVDSSTHQFGTTFDLSWSNFYCADSLRTIDEGDLKNLLAEVLNDLRNHKRCMVKFERKTACFHITVTKP